MLLPKMLVGAAKKKMQFAFMFIMGKGRGTGRELYTHLAKFLKSTDEQQVKQILVGPGHQNSE
jgi:hypothetical protein